MTDTYTPPAPPAAPSVAAPPASQSLNWTNVVALGIAAATAIGGLAAIRLGVAPADVHWACGSIITACAMAYGTGR